MLRLLRIRNLALIRELEIEFGRGLNLLTGETGSGKSILVDALGLLLGSRSSQEMIRSDCESAVLEGIFETESCPSVSALLASTGFDSDDSSLLIRREISISGRNRVFINSHLGTDALLKAGGYPRTAGSAVSSRLVYSFGMAGHLWRKRRPGKRGEGAL